MSTRKILIIEDDPIILYLYKTHFERAGFEVKVANNGEAGFYLLHQSPTDAVLLDLMLPKINGVQVLKSIRSSDAFPNIPVFVFTNVYLSDLAKQAKAAGATKVFDKAAIIPLDLIDAVREALDPGSPRAPSTNSRSRSDLNFEVIRSFRETAPKTINALRKTLLALSKSSEDGVRVSRLSELYEGVHTFAGGASAAGFRVLAEMSAALEALLSELSGRLEQVNASTLRTVSHAIDFLDVLFTSPKAKSEPLLAGPLKALIVDDEIISRRAVIASLERARLRWVESECPYLALSLLKEQSFDLVFLDVSMPEMDGFEVCLELRRFPGHKKTPVIFVTALTDFESRSRSTLSGGTDLIAKPFLFTELAVKALNHGLKYRMTHSATSSKELAQRQTPQPREGSSLPVFGEVIDSANDGSIANSQEKLDEAESDRRSDGNGRLSVQQESNVQAQLPGYPNPVSVEKSAAELNIEDCDAGNSSLPSPICVLTLDETGKIQMLNDAAGLMFGYQISDIKDRLLTSLLFQANEKDVSLESLTKFFGGKSPTSKISDKFIGKRKDGSTFLLNLSLNEIVVGGQRMFTGILRDLPRTDSAGKRLDSGQSFSGEVVPQTDRLLHPELPNEENVALLQAESDEGKEPSEVEKPIERKRARHPGTGQKLAKELDGREGSLQDQMEQLSGELVQKRKTEEEFIRTQKHLELGIQEKCRELSNIQGELQDEQSRRQKAEARSKEIDVAYEVLTKEVMDQRQTESGWRRQCREMEIILEKRADELVRAREELRKVAADRDEIEARASNLASTCAALPKELMEHRATEARLRSANQESQDQIKAQSDELTDIRDELTKAGEKCQQLEINAAEVEAARNTLQKELTNRSQAELSLQHNNDELQIRLARQLAALGEVQAELQKRTVEAEARQAAMNELKLAKESLVQQRVEHQTIERELREDHERLKKCVARQDSHLESLQAELERRSNSLDQAQSDLGKQVQTREHFETRARELAFANEALECQLAEHERFKHASRQQEEELKGRLSTQLLQLDRARGELEKKALEHQQLLGGAEVIAEKHAALTVELIEAWKKISVRKPSI